MLPLEWRVNVGLLKLHGLCVLVICFTEEIITPDKQLTFLAL